MNNIFYVYIYFDPFNGIPFYVGKGKNGRAWEHLKNKEYKNNNKLFKNKINKIKANNSTPIVILYSEHLTEEEAFVLEKELILFYGRRDKNTGCLCNLNDGGSGGNHNLGRKHSEESKEKMSKKQKGKVVSKNTREKIAKALSGRKLSKEHCKKMGESKKGKKLTEEHINKIKKNNKGMTGKHHTEEAKLKMSLKKKGKESPRKGKHHTEETKQKLREINIGKCAGEKNYFYGKHFYGEDNINYGKHHTEETREKMRIAAKNKQPMSEETKLKISLASKGRVSNRKGIKLTQEQKDKIKETKNKNKISMAFPL